MPNSTVNESNDIKLNQKNMKTSTDKLPIIENCNDCGVCCFHMGYPAFMLPREKFTMKQIAQHPECQQLLNNGWTQQELLDGHPGESHWHRLPENLKTEWQEFVAKYKSPGHLDKKCFWLDPESNLCKHHEYRPQVCRDFEIGCSECRSWRKHFGLDD